MSNKVLVCVEDNLLFQKVEEIIKSLSSLDLILTSRDELFMNMKVVRKLGGSDHDMIAFMNVRKMTQKDPYELQKGRFQLTEDVTSHAQPI